MFVKVCHTVPLNGAIKVALRALERDSKLRQMSSTDAPVNTVRKLQKKPEELQSTYVVISGSEVALIKKK